MPKKTKKVDLPPEALEFFRKTGAIGGSAKVPKGLAAMDDEKRKAIQAKALKTRRANAKKRAKKKAG